jgi:hypothetical protein
VYLPVGEVTRNVLLALVDVAPKSILFNGKSRERLNKHYGLDTEMLSLVESAWRADVPGEKDSEEEHPALRDFSTPLVEERMAPVTLRRLNRVRERSCRNISVLSLERYRCAMRRSCNGQRLSSSVVMCCATLRVRHRRRRSTDGICYWPWEGRTGGGSVSREETGFDRY